MAVGSQIAITNILADLNLAVWYGIAIHIYASKKFLADFNLAVAQAVQSAKFKSPPNFPAIRYLAALPLRIVFTLFHSSKFRLSSSTTTSVTRSAPCL